MPCFIGVEGGGTKTSVVVVDAESGEVVGAGAGEGSNFYLHKDAAACAAAIKRTIDAVVAADVQPIVGIGLCVSGAGTEPARSHLRDAVAHAYTYDAPTVTAASDAYSALAAAVPSAVGCVLVAGTGSVGMRFDEASGPNPAARCGGWGHLVGDEGSAFSIAMGAIKAVLNHADGIVGAEGGDAAVDTRVAWSAIRARFGVAAPAELVPLLYGAPRVEKARIAALARDLAAAAPTDPLCAALFRAAGAALGRMLGAVLRGSDGGGGGGGEIPVVLVVGVFASWALLRASFLGALATSASRRSIAARSGGALVLLRLERSAAYGAAALVAAAVGRPLTAATTAAAAAADDGTSPAAALDGAVLERIAALPRAATTVSAAAAAAAAGSQALPPDRSHVTTEQRNPLTTSLHRLTPRQCIAALVKVDEAVCPAVRAASSAIGDFLAAAADGFCRGGRLVYVGAGTSGRLGVLDASEVSVLLSTVTYYANRAHNLTRSP